MALYQKGKEEMQDLELLQCKTNSSLLMEFFIFHEGE